MSKIEFIKNHNDGKLTAHMSDRGVGLMFHNVNHLRRFIKALDYMATHYEDESHTSGGHIDY